MKYTYYSTEDFIQDDAFIAWVKEGKQERFWQAFLAEHPEKIPAVNQARTLILATIQAPKQTINFQEKHVLWQSIQTKIEQDTKPEYFPINSRRSSIQWITIASTALVACLVVVFLVGNKITLPENLFSDRLEVSSIVKERNLKPIPKAIQLPDGSSIILQPQASITYAKADFNTQQRKVYLDGEAFFEVKKNPNVPFFVHARGLVAKVLGTSFTISAREDAAHVEVNVKTGKVSVFSETDPEAESNLAVTALKGNILTENEHIRLRKTDQSWSVVVKKPYVSVQSTSTSFQFNDIPANQALDSLAMAYGLTMVYDKRQLAHCRVTAYLTDQPLAEKLDLLCQVLESTYTITENRVEIFSKGCP